MLGEKLSLTSSDAGPAEQPGLAPRPQRGTFPAPAPVPDGAGQPVLPSPRIPALLSPAAVSHLAIL